MRRLTKHIPFSVSIAPYIIITVAFRSIFSSKSPLLNFGVPAFVLLAVTIFELLIRVTKYYWTNLKSDFSWAAMIPIRCLRAWWILAREASQFAQVIFEGNESARPKVISTFLSFWILSSCYTVVVAIWFVGPQAFDIYQRLDTNSKAELLTFINLNDYSEEDMSRDSLLEAQQNRTSELSQAVLQRIGSYNVGDLENAVVQAKLAKLSEAIRNAKEDIIRKDLIYYALMSGLLPILFIVQGTLLHFFLRSPYRSASDTIRTMLWLDVYCSPLYIFSSVVAVLVFKSYFLDIILTIGVFLAGIFKAIKLLASTHRARPLRTFCSLLISSFAGSLLRIGVQLALILGFGIGG